AGDRGQVQVGLDGAVDEVEPLRQEGRAGGKQGPKRSQIDVGGGLVAVLLERGKVFGTGAEDRQALLLGEPPEHSGVGMERAAVIQDERRTRCERARQPVPHHPAAGREVEDAVAAPDVRVEEMLLLVLQQRSARAVHDALRNSRRSGGVEDVERMIERSWCEAKWRSTLPERMPVRRA